MQMMIGCSGKGDGNSCSEWLERWELKGFLELYISSINSVIMLV